VPCTTSTLATPSAWKGRVAPSSERLRSASSGRSSTAADELPTVSCLPGKTLRMSLILLVGSRGVSRAVRIRDGPVPESR